MKYFINFKNALKFINLPHGTLSVAYCIKMWCMLTTVSRSTRHSAVRSYNEEVQSVPHIDKLFLRPSTALYAVLTRWLCRCHVVLLSAMFSEKYLIRVYNFFVYVSILFFIIIISKVCVNIIYLTHRRALQKKYLLMLLARKPHSDSIRESSRLVIISLLVKN